MAVDTSQFRNGLKIELDGEPFTIVYFQHVKPGKGGAFVRTKVKNLLSGKSVDKTFRSGEKIGDPEIEEKSMSFLYDDGSAWHFMDQKTYDQVELDQEALGGTDKFLLPEMRCSIMFWKGRAISVEIPQQVELKITHCEPGVKGDTATNVTKAATLETGAIVQVCS